MRFIRLAAMVGSLILLVATLTSVVHRRGDLRDAQAASVEQASLLASQSIRNSITRVRQDVHLAASASSNPDFDTSALADELLLFFPDAEVCVGDITGCTGADLFALNDIAELAASSEQVSRDSSDGDTTVALAEIAVDASSESLLVVRQVRTETGIGIVAMRLPVETLLSPRVMATVDANDGAIIVDSRSQSAIDEISEAEQTGDRRFIVETIGAPFANGSLEVTSEVTRPVGIAGEATARYAALLALGTILLALAGWTFFVERRQLEKRATTDELTDLINRREFERVSDEALDMADRFNTGLCVMVIDLNGFKQVNDTLGHQFGDLVLAASAERLVDAVRDTDVVGRWGGDEFVILLPGLAERTAVRHSAERIWNRLSGTPVVGDTVMTASIGAAIFPRHGTSLDALMRAADVAMYEAKTTGVSHRIADTIAVTESMLSESNEIETAGAEGSEPEEPVEPTPEVITDDYIGTDRRRSPVPPPPQPPAILLPPPDGDGEGRAGSDLPTPSSSPPF